MPASFSFPSCGPLQLFVDFSKPPHNFTQARMEGSGGVCYRPMSWNSRRLCCGVGRKPGLASHTESCGFSTLLSAPALWDTQPVQGQRAERLLNKAFSPGKHTCVFEHCAGGRWVILPLLPWYIASPSRWCWVCIPMVQITSSSTLTRWLRSTLLKAAVQITCFPRLCIFKLPEQCQNSGVNAAKEITLHLSLWSQDIPNATVWLWWAGNYH